MEGSTMRSFRSRLNELPVDLKCQIGELVYQKGMLPSSRKKKCVELLKEYKIDFTEVGTGTNRFIVRYDGFALKIALDKEGVADNIQEWVMGSELDNVAYNFEISKGGNFLVEEYVPAFTSYSEMWYYQSTIRKILADWNQRGYLLGDVGICRENYANWGLAPGGIPKCIDYAYIFPASMDLFKCTCGSKNISPDSNFTSYKCNICGTQFEDREIRSKISQETRMRLYNQVKGVEMMKTHEMHESSTIYDPVDTNPDSPDMYKAVHDAILMSGIL